ncbi:MULTISPECIES: hypothetical protein [Aquimarina]|uniref:hypothetical protein n=1 Tax=Aquimarina TaxID=290174 RepID=UPI00135B232C|nr:MULTISPECIES: hypothetical protein [Aquimarina]
MKKILNLTGVQKLSKEQQQNINGSASRGVCCPSGRGCLIAGRFCEPGRCNPWGGCVFY